MVYDTIAATTLSIERLYDKRLMQKIYMKLCLDAFNALKKYKFPLSHSIRRAFFVIALSTQFYDPLDPRGMILSYLQIYLSEVCHLSMLFLSPHGDDRSKIRTYHVLLYNTHSILYISRSQYAHEYQDITSINIINWFIILFSLCSGSIP